MKTETLARTFDEILARVDGHPVVLDESVLHSNLRQFLNDKQIVWRMFRQGVTDEDIMRNLRPGEIVITADRHFAYVLRERAILIPLSKTRYHQMLALHKQFNPVKARAYADVNTCPICTRVNKEEFTWWDNDHTQRHSVNPNVHITKQKR